MLKPQQVKKRPTIHRAHDGAFSVLGGLTLEQKRNRDWLPLPLNYHRQLAWALTTCRGWQYRHRGRNENLGMRRAASVAESLLDDVIQSDRHEEWALYYKDVPLWIEVVEPIKSLIMVMAVLLSIPDLHKYDPRLQLVLDYCDYSLGKYGRAKAKAEAKKATRH